VATSCDRRDFMRGAWGAGAGPGGGTARLVVQVRPARLLRAEAAIRALGGITVENRDPRGKLALAVEAAAVADTLGALARIPDVLSTNLLNPMSSLPGARP
jgi:nitrate reductase NapAB chaperone NapD